MLLRCMRNQHVSVGMLQKKKKTKNKEIFCLWGFVIFLETTFIVFYFSSRLDTGIKESREPYVVSMECSLFE